MSDGTAIAWEPLASLLDDGMADLVREHWEEVGVHKDEMPLAVDWDKYQRLEDEGMLRVLGARRGKRLVGYNSFMVMPHIHYSGTMHALGDAIFVTTPARRSGVGVRLIQVAERLLAEIARPGYVRIVYHDKAHLELLGPTLRKLGYGAIETVYDKVVRA